MSSAYMTLWKYFTKTVMEAELHEMVGVKIEHLDAITKHENETRRVLIRMSQAGYNFPDKMEHFIKEWHKECDLAAERDLAIINHAEQEKCDRHRKRSRDEEHMPNRQSLRQGRNSTASASSRLPATTAYSNDHYNEWSAALSS